MLKKLESEGITFNGVDGVDASVADRPPEQALIRLLAAFPAEIVAAADRYDPPRITRYCTRCGLGLLHHPVVGTITPAA